MRQRVVFYQHYPLPDFGIVSIAGHLKQHGVHSEVVVASLEKAPLAVIAGLAPTIVGISAMSVEHRWLAGAASQLRKALPDAVIIVPMFGKLIQCECLTPEQQSNQIDDYGLLPAERGLRFEAIVKTSAITPALKAITEAENRWVYIWGGYGTGKTTLLKTAVAEALRAGRLAVYVNMAG